MHKIVFTQILRKQKKANPQSSRSALMPKTICQQKVKRRKIELNKTTNRVGRNGGIINL